MKRIIKKTFYRLEHGGMFEYEYAVENPDDVAALIFLDTANPYLWWMAKKKLYDWTDDRMWEDYRSWEMWSDRWLNLINVLATPFGIMQDLVADKE